MAAAYARGARDAEEDATHAMLSEHAAAAGTRARARMHSVMFPCFP